MTRSALNLVVALCALLASGTSHACLPASWIEDYRVRQSAATYAQALMTHGSAIVYARVIAVSTEADGKYVGVSRAKIEVLEHFKGPPQIEEINTLVKFFDCYNPQFSKGEQRLFVLTPMPDIHGIERLYEVHEWRSPLSNPPFLNEADLITELRNLRLRSMQPNQRFEPTAASVPLAVPSSLRSSAAAQARR